MDNKNTDTSAIYRLLEAKQSKTPSKIAWYPNRIDEYRIVITEEISGKFSEEKEEKQEKTISNICYSMQMLELYIKMATELYLSATFKRLVNKQIVVTTGSIIEGLISITDEKLYSPSKSFCDKICKAFTMGIIDKSMKDQLSAIRTKRNSVHLVVKDNCLTDYDTFCSNKETNVYINCLNALLSSLISKSSNKIFFDSLEEELPFDDLEF